MDSAAIIRKTRDDYNTIARHFAQTREYIRPEFVYFRDFIKNGQNILDWGCGNGRMIFCLSGKKDVKYYGLDQSKELLKIARRKFAVQLKDGTAKFYCTAGGNKVFPDNFFDLVLVVASLFHLPDEASRLKLLRQLWRQMKPGAKLVVMVWNLESDWAKVKAKRGWKKIGPNDFLIPWRNSRGEILCERYYHHFTPTELSDLLRQAGFRLRQKIKFMKQGAWTDDKGGQNMIAVATKPQSD